MDDPILQRINDKIMEKRKLINLVRASLHIRMYIWWKATSKMSPKVLKLQTQKFTI